MNYQPEICLNSERNCHTDLGSIDCIPLEQHYLLFSICKLCPEIQFEENWTKQREFIDACTQLEN